MFWDKKTLNVCQFKYYHYLCTAFFKHIIFFNYLNEYESIRNRFHFDSRFV